MSTIYYVSKSGLDSNNGLTVGTAFATLKYAMTTPIVLTGDIIRVGQGSFMSGEYVEIIKKNVFYVEETGLDTNNGSSSAPFKTLQYAISNANVIDGDSIILGEGGDLITNPNSSFQSKRVLNQTPDLKTVTIYISKSLVIIGSGIPTTGKVGTTFTFTDNISSSVTNYPVVNPENGFHITTSNVILSSMFVKFADRGSLTSRTLVIGGSNLTLNNISLLDLKVSTEKAANVNFPLYIDNGVTNSGLFSNITINNCEFLKGVNGIKISDKTRINGFKLLNCKVYDNSDYGFHCPTPGTFLSTSDFNPELTNVTIDNCQFYNNGLTPASSNATYTSGAIFTERLANSIISNCVFTAKDIWTGKANHLVQLNIKRGDSNGSNITITNCQFIGGNIKDATGTIANPTIAQNLSGGLNIKGRSDGTSYSKDPGSVTNLVCTNNTITGFGLGLVIESNIFNGGTGIPGTISLASSIFTNNLIDISNANASPGPYLRIDASQSIFSSVSSSNIISSNLITDDQRALLMTKVTDSRTILKSGMIYTYPKLLTISSMGPLIQACNIASNGEIIYTGATSNTDPTFYTYTETLTITMTKSVKFYGPNKGINYNGVRGQEAVFSNCKFQIQANDIEFNGIRFTASSATETNGFFDGTTGSFSNFKAQYCIFDDINGTLFNLTGSNYQSITGTTIQNCKISGIGNKTTGTSAYSALITNSSNLNVSNCLIEYIDSNAITLNSSNNATITNNLINNIGRSGISLMGSCTGTFTITGNTFTKNNCRYYGWGQINTKSTLQSPNNINPFVPRTTSTTSTAQSQFDNSSIKLQLTNQTSSNTYTLESNTFTDAWCGYQIANEFDNQILSIKYNTFTSNTHGDVMIYAQKTNEYLYDLKNNNLQGAAVKLFNPSVSGSVDNPTVYPGNTGVTGLVLLNSINPVNINLLSDLPVVGTLNISSSSSVTYGDLPIHFSNPNSTSTGTWTYLSSNESVATVANNKITIVGAGTTTITALQNFTIDFREVKVTANLAVDKKSLTITPDNKTMIYGSLVPQLTYTTSGLVGSDTIGNSITGSLSTQATSSSVVGTYTIINPAENKLSSSKYELTVLTGSLIINPATLTVIADNKSITYGDTIPSLTYTATGFVLGQTKDIITGTLTTSANTNSIPGSYDITVGTLGAPNYQITSGSFTKGILTISKKVLTVGAFTLPSKKYGDTSFTIINPTLSTSSGTQIAKPLVYSISSSSVATVSANTITIVGVGSAILTGTLNDQDYQITPFTATLVVEKRELAIKPDNIVITYGDNIPTLTYTATGFVNSDTKETALSGSLSTTATKTSNIGPYPITIGSLNSNNYSFNLITGSTVTINPKTLTITAQNKTIIYGSQIPSLTYTATGFVDADTTMSGSLTTKATSGSNAGTYSITIGTLAKANYQITPTSFTEGILTITKQSVTASALTLPVKTFGDSAFLVTNPTLSDGQTQITRTIIYSILPSEVASVLGNVITINGVGTANLTGTIVDTNYELTTPITSTLTVNKATPIIGSLVLPNGIIYGSEPITIQNPTSNSSGTWSYTSSNTNVATVSSGIITIVGAGSTVITATQAPTTNFTQGVVTATLTVSKKLLSITPDNKTMIYGNTVPELTFTTNGLVGSDTIVNSLTGSLGTSVTSSSNIGSYAISIGTLGSIKYNLTLVSGTTLTVNPASLTVTADSKTMTYENTVPTLTYTASGFVLEQNESVILGNLTTSANSNTDPGFYDITVGTITAPNYQITFVKGTLTINKAQSQLGSFPTISDQTFNNIPYTPVIPSVIKGRSNLLQFTSSDETVATVNSLGAITMKKAGSVQISVKHLDSAQYLESPVVQSNTFVINKAQSQLGSFVINNQVLELDTANVLIQKVTQPVLPIIIKGSGNIVYSSSNQTFATINSSTGEITAKTTGDVTITATLPDNDQYNSSSVTATFKIIEIPKPPTYNTSGDNSVARHGYLNSIFNNNSNSTVNSFNLDKSKLGLTDGPANYLVVKEGQPVNVSSSIKEDQGAYVNLDADGSIVTLNIGSIPLQIMKTFENSIEKYQVGTDTTKYNKGDSVKMYGMLIKFGGTDINVSQTEIKQSGGTVELRQISNTSKVEYKYSNSSTWSSVDTNWPINITNETTSSTLTINLTSNIVINTTTTGQPTNAYFVIKSNNITIDGKGYRVTLDNVTDYKGLVSNGTGTNNILNQDRKSNIKIKNLGVIASNSTLFGNTQQNAGWIAQSYWGTSDCEITNCYSTGPIAASSGGILGYMGSGIVTDCYSTGSIADGAGGIFGAGATSNASTNNCYSLGSIGSNAGGIFGKLSAGSATNCYSIGSIGTDAGGIRGYSSSVTVINSYSANGTWSDATATSSIGTNRLDITTTPTYNADGTSLNTVGTKWLDINNASTTVPYLLKSFVTNLYSTNTLTKEYGSSSQDSSDGLVIGGTYFLVNNLNGVSINTSSGKLTFGSDVPAGNYSLQILYYDNTLSPLYGYVVGTFNLTINKKSITVTSDNKTKLYGEENPTLTFEASGLVLSQTKSVISGGLKTSATNTSNVGTYSIDVDDTNPLTSQNYIITFVSGTLTINRATPTLGTLNLPNNKIYGDSSFTITNPTSESDGEWTYTNTDSTISISKDSTTKISTITINGATSGPITITGTQTETTNYNSGMVTATFSVGKRPLTITPMSHTIYYGENIPALTYASPTLVHGDIANTVITGSMTCTATNSSNVGSYSISVGTLTSNKYDITFITTSSVTILPKTITVTAANKTMEFGNTLPTLTWTVTGFNGTDNFITGSLSTAVTSSSVPGTYDIVKGSLALTSGNYQITAESFVKGTLTVTKATLTPSTLTFTNKKYLDAAFTFANPTLTTSYGDQVIKTINYTSSNSNIASISGNTITIIKPGTITITGNLTDNNYQMNQFTSSLTIEKLVPVVGSLVLPAKSFGNSPFSISNPDSSSSGSWSYTSSVPSVISVTNASTFSVNGIGDTTITATQATTEYYEQIIITGTLTVSKETPSIGTLLIPAKKFGDLPFDLTNPTSTSTGSWSYTSSNASVVTISGNTVTIIGVGDVNITATQASNANYNAASVSSTLSVGKGKLNITQSFSITNQVKPVTTATIPLPVLSIPSGHGGTWSFSSSNTEIAQISGTNVTILNKTGTVKITATLSADSKYLESTLFTQFSVSEGVASSFTYINKSSVISSITDTTLTGQTVDLKNKFDSNKINELNPSTGTTNEKMENRDLVVKSLFETFSSSQKIEVPKEVIYLPDSIKSFVTSSVTLINSSTSNSSSPTVVPATDITSSGAVFINTPDVGNSVRFDGTGPYAGSSIKITKQTNNYDIDKTNNSSPLPTVQMVKGDTIQFGGFIIVLGSITAIPYIPPLSSGSIPQTPMDIIWDKIKTGGDPIIQPLMGTSYALAPHIKYVNLLADYTNKIFINAQVDLLTIKDFPKKIYWDTSFSDISEVSHVYSNSYYRKFQITYNTETIEINADTLEIKQLTPIIKIKSGKFMPKTGLNSISFNKIYPKTNATKGLRIGLADYLITFVSDINTDDRHSIELLKTKKSNLNNICGALICKDQIIKISDLTGFELYQFNSSPFGEDINNVSLA